MIIDTNHRTTAKLACLASAGVSALIRYYARVTSQPEKRLTRAEAEAVRDAGMSIAIVHEAAGNHAEAFSHDTGVADASYARNYGAKVIGQPAGSAIYFGVDYDSKEPDITNRIVPYFQAVRTVLSAPDGSPVYRIGVYGDGVTLKALLDAGLVDFTWISQSTGFPGSKQFKASNRWTLFQHLPSTVCDLDVDVNDLNPAGTDFGAFSRLDSLAVPGMHQIVKARSGLRLRAGPGTNFDVQKVLPFGTSVSVVSRSGDFAAIDLDGDGAIDGFALAAFLADA
jgi:glycoside hydrolase-like protein/SH3 domain-containing protein